MASSSTSTSGDERPPAGVLPRDPSSVAPQTQAEWAASLQAYYAAAQQHMVAAAAAAGPAPYGAPMPFPMYHPAAYYAHHASMAAGVPAYPVGEAALAVEGSSKMKKKSSCASSGDASSRSVRSSDAGSEESSHKRDARVDPKVLTSAKRRKPSNANAKGESSSQPGTTQDSAAALPVAAKALKLSVQTPGESAAVSDAAPNLNIGMDIWGSPPARAETSEQGEVNAGAAPHHASSLPQMLEERPPARAETSEQGEVNAGAPSHHAGSLPQMQDERELKRERRKQSNRESARRSRLRKQQECEELSQKVTELTAVNGALKIELDQLKKACEDMEAENSQIMGELEQTEGPAAVSTTLSMQTDASKARPGNNGRLQKNNHDNKG